MEKIQLVLAVVGAVALGLPALLHAVVLFLKAIPGEQGETFLEQKVLPWCDKVSELVAKLFPGKK